MDRVGNAVLQAVLDSRRTKEVQVLLDDFGNLVELLATVGHLSGSIVVERGPLAVFLLGDVTVCETQRSETLGGIILEMNKGRLGELLVLLAEALEDDSVGSLREQLNASVRAANND